ncbi:RNA/RNP complex-1-interacting phosphatase-like isoform X5 [Canis aureus]
MVKKNSIPDGWRTVTPIGHPVPGTRFIAFKVPLKGAVNQRLTPTQKFTPKDLISAIKALNVELGLIIDLTYTTRYYEVKDLPKSIHYKKLYTVGLEVPDNATILQFKKWVRKFLWENAENGKLIGVHCTNGINRTGYLICRYLIDVEGWDPDTAIQVILEWMSGILMKMQISHLIQWKTLKIGPQMKTFMGLGKGQDILMTSTLEMIHSVMASPEKKQISTRYKEQDRDHFMIISVTVAVMNQMLEMILILLAKLMDKGDIPFRNIRPIVIAGNNFQQKILVLLTEVGNKNDNLSLTTGPWH